MQLFLALGFKRGVRVGILALNGVNIGYCLVSDRATTIMVSPNFGYSRILRFLASTTSGRQVVVLARKRCSRVNCTGRLSRLASAEVTVNGFSGGTLSGECVGLSILFRSDLRPFSTSCLLGSNSKVSINSVSFAMLRATNRAINSVSLLYKGALFSNSALFGRDVKEASFLNNDFNRVRGSIGRLCALPSRAIILSNRNRSAAVNRRGVCGACVENWGRTLSCWW